MSKGNGVVARKRSSQQNRLFWELMTLLEKEWEVEGKKYSKDAWHDLMVIMFLDKVSVKLPTGEIYEKYRSTSTLPMFPSKDNPDDRNNWESFYLSTEAYCAENGYYLDEKS